MVPGFLSTGGRTLTGLFWNRGLASFVRRPDREILRYDVLIVGAGPSGLCAAIRIKQVGSDFGGMGHHPCDGPMGLVEALRHPLFECTANKTTVPTSLTVQLCKEKDRDLSVCVIDKGSDVGAL
jgi:hypothetical protein